MPAKPDRESSQIPIDTLNRERVKNVVEFVKDFDLQRKCNISHNDIFKWAGVKRRRGWEMLREDYPQRTQSHCDRENRGRPHAITHEDFKKLEDLIESGGFEGRICDWKQALIEAVPEKAHLHHQTVRNAFHAYGYHRCTACQKPWLTPEAVDERRRFYWDRKDWTVDMWRRVRFSDEVHFGLGPQRNLKVIQKPGQRYHPDCIQRNQDGKKASDKNEKHLHCWAAVGYGFKSRLIFYETSSSNGKMTQSTYLTKILCGEVQLWIDRGDEFIFEEDQDSDYDVADNTNPVRQWKNANRLQYLFNASGSLNLTPIENVWRAEKQLMNDWDHVDDGTLESAILNAWEQIKQKTIDKYCDSMIERMRELIRHRYNITQS